MFVFPDDVCWNEAEDAVEFGIQLGDYAGKVFLPRRLFQTLIGGRPKAEDCISHFHLNRPAFERIAEARVHARHLDDDANIRVTGRDLRACRRL
jgi:hypothetical protein